MASVTHLGLFPFCVPTQIDGVDIEVWDGVTVYEETAPLFEETPEFGFKTSKRASNSSSSYIPVVGGDSGWVEISLETALKLYWRAKGLTISESSLSASLAIPIDNEGELSFSVQTNFNQGQKKVPFTDTEKNLVCRKLSIWENVLGATPGHGGTIRPRLTDPFETAAPPDWISPDSQEAGTFTVSGATGLANFTTFYIFAFFGIEDEYVYPGFANYQRLDTAFRAVKTIPNKIFVNIGAFFSMGIGVTYTENFPGGGVRLGSPDFVEYKEQIFGYPPEPELQHQKRTGQTMTINLLGEVINVSIDQYIRNYDVYNQGFPTSFSVPSVVTIDAEEWWPYDPGDGLGPIYDSATGAQLRDF